MYKDRLLAAAKLNLILPNLDLKTGRIIVVQQYYYFRKEVAYRGFDMNECF